MKNNTNFPKPKRGYILDAGDKRAIAKTKQEAKTKLRTGNKISSLTLISQCPFCGVYGQACEGIEERDTCTKKPW